MRDPIRCALEWVRAVCALRPSGRHRTRAGGLDELLDAAQGLVQAR